MRYSRAAFIGVATLGATALVAGRGAAESPRTLVRLDPALTPVDIDAARVIRTVVGLRPFRAAGFVLRAQSLGGKLLVHDYGHGGGGFSLSWGCATLAADLVGSRSPARAAVLGCGVIGLTTARVLQDRGWTVTIYASAVPPQTTSNIAGAQWTPTTVFSSDAADAGLPRCVPQRRAHRQSQFPADGRTDVRRAVDEQLRAQARGRPPRRTRLCRVGRYRRPLRRRRRHRPRVDAVRRLSERSAVRDDVDRAEHFPAGRRA